MRQLTLSLLVILLAVGNTFAQKHLFGMQVTKWGISAGMEQDMLSEISHEYLLSTAKGAPDISAFSDGTLDFYTGTCENPHVRFDLVLAPTFMRNAELQLSALGIFNRVDGATYYQLDESGNSNFLSFYGYGHELAIESALMKTAKLGPLRFYGGAGGNLGYSFGNHINVHGSTTATVEDISIRSSGFTTAMQNLNEWTQEESVLDAYYDGKAGFHQRIFLKAGFGISFFKRVELGMDIRKGLGLREFVGASVKGTDYTSVAFTLKYLLKSSSCCTPTPACCKKD